MADRAFVAAFAGIPGAGKTTLLRRLLRDYPQAQAVFYDGFHPGLTEQKIQDWFRRRGDPNEFPLTELIGELTRRTRIPPGMRHQPLVLFETAFGRAHRATGAFIDLLVWIDTPLDLALTRTQIVSLDNLLVNKAPNATADFIQRLTRYARDYPMLRQTYLAISKQAAAAADLVLDGTMPPEALAKSVSEALAARGFAPSLARGQPSSAPK